MVESITVTTKLLVAVFPEASVPLYVTVVLPTGKKLPLAGPAIRSANGLQLNSMIAGRQQEN